MLRRGGKKNYTNTQKNYTKKQKKNVHNPDNHNPMITHLGPGIMKCIVKWALRSITMTKGGGSEGIQVSDFKS